MVTNDAEPRAPTDQRAAKDSASATLTRALTYHADTVPVCDTVRRSVVESKLGRAETITFVSLMRGELLGGGDSKNRFAGFGWPLIDGAKALG